MEKLLEVAGLKKYFPIRKGSLFSRETKYVRAVDDVSFDIHKGEVLGLVGESGSGKTTTGRLLVRLLKATEGDIVFEGKDTQAMTDAQFRPLRRDMQFIFQDPYSSLNPRLTVAHAIAEPIRLHGVATGKEVEERVGDLMNTVGLNPRMASRYPHEFSGGQRQRIGIARALALNPKLIIADEPVSALDVSIQAQVLNLLHRLRDEFGLSYLFIAHDLNVVQHLCERIAVMYLGKLVEVADRESLYAEPLHPYTQALTSAIPVPNPRAKRDRVLLKGEIPSPVNPPSGCHFHPRCQFATEQCRQVVPTLKKVNATRSVACHLY
ncbi:MULTISPECIES: ABC transporter ATP-binding protein [Thalassobaculum]|uniref:Oligopeptide transport system ATP-binding protein n=1 Tax=Thalassobaculum litoreum DSM 18839 TaxID=1123362 RepID=A0A8G2EY56_9PROT|nr:MULTISPECIES: oligopeptide/dipeptide ABC transporter ATP-binding protein [Thalassobaculum]SDF50187.1 oligopeptide transport system ATP-binding protein [Thalassobaculum litoreum DSM 18839]